MAARLVDARGEARVGADLLGRAEAIINLADFRDDQHRRVQADSAIMPCWRSPIRKDGTVAGYSGGLPT
jgi:hypothetical protein